MGDGTRRRARRARGGSQRDARRPRQRPSGPIGVPPAPRAGVPGLRGSDGRSRPPRGQSGRLHPRERALRPRGRGRSRARARAAHPRGPASLRSPRALRRSDVLGHPAGSGARRIRADRREDRPERARGDFPRRRAPSRGQHRRGGVRARPWRCGLLGGARPAVGSGPELGQAPGRRPGRRLGAGLRHRPGRELRSTDRHLHGPHVHRLPEHGVALGRDEHDGPARRCGDARRPARHEDRRRLRSAPRPVPDPDPGRCSARRPLCVSPLGDGRDPRGRRLIRDSGRDERPRPTRLGGIASRRHVARGPRNDGQGASARGPAAVAWRAAGRPRAREGRAVRHRRRHVPRRDGTSGRLGARAAPAGGRGEEP